MRSWRTLSRASLVAALSAAFLGAMAPAHANPVDGSFDSAIGAGSSSQHMRWKQPSQRVRLWVTFAGNPNSTGGRCQETATLDTQSKPTLVGTAGGKSQTISMAPTSHRCSVWDPTCLKTGTLVTSSTAATCTGHVPLQPCLARATRSGFVRNMTTGPSFRMTTSQPGAPMTPRGFR